MTWDVALPFVGGLIAVAVPGWLGFLAYRASQAAKERERDAERVRIEGEAYVRARQFDDDVVARLTSEIQRLEERATKAEQRAEQAEERARAAEERARAAEERADMLTRRLNAAGIPEDTEEPR